MKQANEKPAQPASLDALVGINPDQAHLVMNVASTAEKLLDDNPAAGMLGLYLAKAMIPTGAKDAATAFDKQIKVYEGLLKTVMESKARAYGMNGAPGMYKS